MSIHEECGVFGAIAKSNIHIGSLVYYGLYALQHRGQESCGIVVNDDGVYIAASESAALAALGYSHKSGIPYSIGLIKNKYIGRTFISPGQSTRLDQVKIKLATIEENVKGKRIVLVDDSIVRGTTSGIIVKLLRDAGASEIHMRISSPPFLHPCYYGTDIDSEENLIAASILLKKLPISSVRTV